jgi:chromosome transmission fidelity protein 18
MYTDGDFAILAYLPYTLVPFHPLFQERGTSTVEKNSDDWDVSLLFLCHFVAGSSVSIKNLQATRANEEIYKSLIKCIRSASSANGGDFRNFVTTPNLQLEFAPYLNRIISPPLRPVSQLAD